MLEPWAKAQRLIEPTLLCNNAGMQFKSKGDSLTSLGLLEDLKDSSRSEEAWNRFASRYGPKIYKWCKTWGVQDADADDITQNVLLQLARQLKSFDYDPNSRFRSWLKTVTWRAWAKFLAAKKKSNNLLATGDQLEVLNSTEAHDSLMSLLDKEADREILEIALAQIKKRVKPQNFEAFHLMAFEGLTGDEVATRLGMHKGSVFVAKARIDKMLTECVQQIDQYGEPV